MAILKAIQDFGNWFWGIPILILIGGGGLFLKQIDLRKIRYRFQPSAKLFSAERTCLIFQHGNNFIKFKFY